MSGFERILVAVDVLRPSKTVVNYGVSLALQFNAKLRLAHIIPSSAPLLYSAPSENDALTREIAYAKAMLPSLVPKEHRRQLDLRAIVRVGDVPSELGKIVDDEKIDLVTVAAPGWHPLEQGCEGIPSAADPSQPLFIDNTMHPANSRIALAHATESHLHAFGIDWDNTSGENNGHFAPFNWRSS